MKKQILSLISIICAVYILVMALFKIMEVKRIMEREKNFNKHLICTIANFIFDRHYYTNTEWAKIQMELINKVKEWGDDEPLNEIMSKLDTKIMNLYASIIETTANDINNAARDQLKEDLPDYSTQKDELDNMTNALLMAATAIRQYRDEDPIHSLEDASGILDKYRVVNGGCYGIKDRDYKMCFQHQGKAACIFMKQHQYHFQFKRLEGDAIYKPVECKTEYRDHRILSDLLLSNKLSGTVDDPASNDQLCRKVHAIQQVILQYQGLLKIANSVISKHISLIIAKEDIYKNYKLQCKGIIRYAEGRRDILKSMGVYARLIINYRIIKEDIDRQRREVFQNAAATLLGTAKDKDCKMQCFLALIIETDILYNEIIEQISVDRDSDLQNLGERVYHLVHNIGECCRLAQEISSKNNDGTKQRPIIPMNWENLIKEILEAMKGIDYLERLPTREIEYGSITYEGISIIINVYKNDEPKLLSKYNDPNCVPLSPHSDDHCFAI